MRANISFKHPEYIAFDEILKSDIANLVLEVYKADYQLGPNQDLPLDIQLPEAKASSFGYYCRALGIGSNMSRAVDETSFMNVPFTMNSTSTKHISRMEQKINELKEDSSKQTPKPKYIPSLGAVFLLGKLLEGALTKFYKRYFLKGSEFRAEFGEEIPFQRVDTFGHIQPDGVVFPLDPEGKLEIDTNVVVSYFPAEFKTLSEEFLLRAHDPETHKVRTPSEYVNELLFSKGELNPLHPMIAQCLIYASSWSPLCHDLIKTLGKQPEPEKIVGLDQEKKANVTHFLVLTPGGVHHCFVGANAGNMQKIRKSWTEVKDQLKSLQLLKETMQEMNFKNFSNWEKIRQKLGIDQIELGISMCRLFSLTAYLGEVRLAAIRNQKVTERMFKNQKAQANTFSKPSPTQKNEEPQTIQNHQTTILEGKLSSTDQK